MAGSSDANQMDAYTATGTAADGHRATINESCEEALSRLDINLSSRIT